MKKPLDGLPKTVRVGATKYDVVVVRPSDNWGRQFETGWIEIADDQGTGVRALETVLHEITHAIYNSYVIRSGDDEERTVTTLAKAFAQVYHDNPALLRWMSKAAK
jgi:hypothetical protein